MQDHGRLARENAALKHDTDRHLAITTQQAGEIAAAEQALGNLLAVIHGDGGHYQSEHGTEKAVADAHLKWAALKSVLSDVLDYRGGADCACKDEYVMGRLRALAQPKVVG
jgi:hypothetical protein